jgi:proline dehydrogenase
MSYNISYNLTTKGYNVSKYPPFSPVKDVMPYLIRRAEENTSVAGKLQENYRLPEKKEQDENLKVSFSYRTNR